MKSALIIAATMLAVGCSTVRQDTESTPSSVSGDRRQNGNAQPSAISVLVAGEVVHPGRYSLPFDTRLTHALSKPGGFKGSAYTRGVKVTRRDGKTYVYDLRRQVSEDEGDPVLHDGDIVAVPYWMRPTL